jgi:RNA polymerase sigma-70 factor (ECF subfamily)
MSRADGFEATVLPLLDAGHNLARWLLRDPAAAEDAVQESVLRALRYFHALEGPQARPWFLGIVRNTCFSQLERQRSRGERAGLEDEELDLLQFERGRHAPDVAAEVGTRQERVLVDAAIRALSAPLREVIVLRELEGLEYREIAEIAGVPIGTVMSRLSRGRSRLKTLLAAAGLP